MLARVPTRLVAPGPAAEQLLGWTLQLVGSDASAREHALRLAARLRQSCREARVGVTLRDVRSVQEAALGFPALEREGVLRGDAPFVSYGLLLDETEIYRALLAREPLAQTRAETRAARAVADLARLVDGDLVGNAA